MTSQNQLGWISQILCAMLKKLEGVGASTARLSEVLIFAASLPSSQSIHAHKNCVIKVYIINFSAMMKTVAICSCCPSLAHGNWLNNNYEFDRPIITTMLLILCYKN